MKALSYKKKSQKRDNRRTKICQIALSLFAKRGYHATTLKDIAEVLEMTHPALYYYYKSKGSLLFDAIKMVLNRLIVDLSTAVQNCPENDHENRLFQLAYTQILIQLEDKGAMPLVDSVLFGTLSNQGLLEEEDRQVLQDLQRQLVELYKKEVIAGIEAEQFSISDPSIVTLTILGAVSYVVYWYKVDKNYTKKDVANKVSKFLTQACKQ